MHNEHMKHQTYQNTVPEPCSSSVNPSGSNVWVVSAFRSGRRVQCGEMWGKEGDANSPCCLGSFGTTCRYGSEKAMAIHSSTLAWKIPWVSDAIQPPRPLVSPISFNSFFFFLVLLNLTRPPKILRWHKVSFLASTWVSLHGNAGD